MTVIAEVEHLLAAREWPPRIADRLGYKDFQVLREVLRRWGRLDLAEQMRADRWNPDIAGGRIGSRNQYGRYR